MHSCLYFVSYALPAINQDTDINHVKVALLWFSVHGQTYHCPTTRLTGSDCSSYAANNFLGYPAYTKKLHKKNKCDSSIKHWQARGYTLELNNLTSKLKANSDPAMKTLSQLTIAPRLLLLNVLRICELFSLNLPAALETCSMFIATNSVNLSSVSAAGIMWNSERPYFNNLSFILPNVF